MNISCPLALRYYYHLFGTNHITPMDGPSSFLIKSDEIRGDWLK